MRYFSSRDVFEVYDFKDELSLISDITYGRADDFAGEDLEFSFTRAVSQFADYVPFVSDFDISDVGFGGFAPLNFVEALAQNSGPNYNTIPGDTSTTATIAVGAQVTETLNFINDQDWFEITLVAGETYDFSMMGTGGAPLSDPLLRLMDAAGVEVATNDDIILGSVTHSLLTFTATTGGTFYVSAQSYNGTSVGDYTLSATLNHDASPDEIAGDNTTTAVAVINGSVSGSIDVDGDTDWFAVTLVAGQRYLISDNGTGSSVLSDPNIVLYDAAGTALAFDNNTGSGLNAKLSFTPDATGVFYIEADAIGSATGDYGISIQEVPTLVFRTIDEVAHFITDEFDTRESYNTGGGGATTINFSFASGANSLSAGAEALARRALDAWAEVANINFVEGAGDIVFRNNGDGAFNSNTTSAGVVQSSDLNVTATWNGSNTNLDSYTYQTFMHEIGHALGLGHAGPYNGSATYNVDNAYLNDSWAYTVMSYFDQNESGYFGDVRFVLGPQIADIVALQDLYGANTTTRNGDTVYGFNSTEALTSVHNFSNPDLTNIPSFSVYDMGGTDTLDFSGYTVAQRIDLNAEAFSDVNGIDGVISISRGSIIENAIGGSGIDTITGNDVSNELTGGAGNDILDGGAGTDYALYSGAQASYTITDNGDGTWTVAHNGGGADGTDTLTNIEFAKFSDGDVALSAPSGPTFTEGADDVTGSSGDDVLNALGGNDIVHGGDGNDTINGGTGNDQLFGDAGDDTLNGDAGADTLFGGAGADVMDGGIGFDAVDYRAATSRVIVNMDTGGTLGDAAGDSYVSIERLYGSNFNDTITGTSANEFLYGEDGNDTINGGGGIDRIYGGDGDDIQRGQGGNDQLYGSAGADQLNGGTGLDIANYRASSAGVTVNMATGGSGGDASGDTYFGIEAVYGSDFVDTLTGNTSSNELRGFDGDDTLDGGSGNDRLFGGNGADTFIGGVGIDIAMFTVASAGVTLDLATGGTGGEAAGDTYSSIEWVFGSNFDDNITGDDGINRLTGNDGNDTLNGAGGNDRLLGGDGNDTIDGGDGVDTIFGQDGDDILSGGAGNDFFFGDTGSDSHDGGTGTDTVSYLASSVGVTLNMQTGGTGGDAVGDSYVSIERIFGTGQDDSITGSNGNDTLLGNGGADYLAGGLGNDSLNGGAGADSFGYNTTSDDGDVINGFTTNETIYILGGDANFDTFAELMAVASNAGANTIINFGGGNTLTIVGHNMAALSASNFDFSGTPPAGEAPSVSKLLVSEDLGIISDIADEPIIDQDLVAAFMAEYSEKAPTYYVDGNGMLSITAEGDAYSDFAEIFDVI